MPYCKDYEYRYVAAYGLERRACYSTTWHRVTPHQMAAMTAEELRHIADVMDGTSECRKPVCQSIRSVRERQP